MNSRFKGNIDRRNILKGLGVASVSAATVGIASTNSTAQDISSVAQGASTVSTERPLKGKVAIVTGARANFGRWFAEALAKNGADVVVHYHREETRNQAEETASLVEAQGSRAELVQGDLGQIDTVMRMFDAATENFGQLDIVINNAGAIVKKRCSALWGFPPL